MSAYMVEEDHLDLLASVAEWGREGLFVFFNDNLLPPRSALEAKRGEGNYYRDALDASLIKEELRLENQASLRYRYDAGEQFDKGQRYRPIYQDQVSFPVVLGALACYEYQACESEEWNKSFAFALCQAIRRRICQMISGDNWSYSRPVNMGERVRII